MIMFGRRDARRPHRQDVCATFRAMTKFDLRRQDCIAGMSRLAEESVDLVLTSPPYNLGISYGKYSDRQDRRAYLGFCRVVLGPVPPRITMNAPFFFITAAAAPH